MKAMVLPVKGYEGSYSVTRDGRVFSLITNKYLKPKANRAGYLRVVLCKDGKVKNTLVHIDAAIDALKKGFTQDIAGMELELALSELGGLDGRRVTEDVVHNIFGRFCIGK